MQMHYSMTSWPLGLDQSVCIAVNAVRPVANIHEEMTEHRKEHH